MQRPSGDDKPRHPLRHTIIRILLIVSFGAVFFVMPDIRLKVAVVIISPLLIAFAVWRYIKERMDDKRAEQQKSGLIRVTRRQNAGWRTRYLDYKMHQGFEEIDPRGMKADLIRRIRCFRNLVWPVVGTVMFAAVGYALLRRGEYQCLLCFFFGALSLAGLIYFSAGGPVRHWIRRCSKEAAKIEHSYRHGRLLCRGEWGINLGHSHIVLFNSSHIEAFPLDRVADMTRKTVRLKTYRNDIYTGQKYKHYVVIQLWDKDSLTERQIELTDFQVEMLLQQYQRLSNPPHRMSALYEEQYKNEIVAP